MSYLVKCVFAANTIVGLGSLGYKGGAWGTQRSAEWAPGKNVFASS